LVVVCVLFHYETLISIQDWDEYLNIGVTVVVLVCGFGPRRFFRKKCRRTQLNQKPHTPEEHHEYILSASYDLSLNGSAQVGGLGPSSLQVGGPGFDNFFSDGLEDGGYGMELGEDLAKELGWAIRNLPP
jgi:hypothetical protein